MRRTNWPCYAIVYGCVAVLAARAGLIAAAVGAPASDLYACLGLACITVGLLALAWRAGRCLQRAFSGAVNLRHNHPDNLT